MKKNKKRMGHALRSTFIFFEKFKYSFGVMFFVVMVHIMAIVNREVLKREMGVEAAYFYSMVRKWVNYFIGYYLLMAFFVLIILCILFYEYKNYSRKESQELD